MVETPKLLHQAVRGFANHLDDIYHAIKQQNGLMTLDNDKENTVKALKKAGLIYMADELDSYMIYGVVARFVRHFDERGRLAQNSFDVIRVVQNIEQAIELHKVANKKGDDKQFALQVQEYILELADILLTICRQFSVNIYEQLANISDIETRIRFNELQIQELNRLNELFGKQFTNQRLTELGLFADEFINLTQKILLPILDKCRQELVIASGKLNSELLKFQKELKNKQTYELIGHWRHYLRKNPNINIDDSLLITAPPVFFGAKLTITSYADWHGLDIDNYVEIAQKCTLKPPQENKPQESQIIVETINETIDERQSPVMQAVIWFFEYVAECGKIDARTAFDKMGVAEYVDFDDWLLLLACHYHAYQNDEFQIEFDGQVLKNYDGTQLVENLTVFCE